MPVWQSCAAQVLRLSLMILEQAIAASNGWPASQFDGLKIDKSFVQGMENHADMAAIVLTSVQIGKQLGLTVTAEGVETASQWGA